MLKRIISLLILVLITGALVSVISGQDTSNNPNENSDANSCYEGGSMEGKCQKDIEWEAGWYIIRYEYGLIGRDQVPSWATWALPPAPVVPRDCTHHKSFDGFFGPTSFIFTNGTLEVFSQSLDCLGTPDRVETGMTYQVGWGPGDVMGFCMPANSISYPEDNGVFYKCQ